mmetsp:Transcript_11097/g.18081  ORF Transcript_11097/g.18081 Transcript_11097/m.18081 type:complete len:378 (+) Transcript_11097:83-1216(+)
MSSNNSIAFEGFLYKRGYFNTAFKRRYFRLCAEKKELRYFEEGTTNGSSCRGSINLIGSTVLLHPADYVLNGFKIACEDVSRTYILKAPNRTLLLEWTSALKKVRGVILQDLTTPPAPSIPAPQPPPSQRKISSIDAPDEFVCPITCELMHNPVSIDKKGQFNFERVAIEMWLEKGSDLNPLTGQPMPGQLLKKEGGGKDNLQPNMELKEKIERWITKMHLKRLGISRKDLRRKLSAREKERRAMMQQSSLAKAKKSGKPKPDDEGEGKQAENAVMMTVGAEIFVAKESKGTAQSEAVLVAEWRIPNYKDATTYDVIAICKSSDSPTKMSLFYAHNLSANPTGQVTIRHQLPTGGEYVLRYIGANKQVLAQSKPFTT